MLIRVTGVAVPQGSKVVMRGRLVDVRSKDLKAWRKTVAAEIAKHFPAPFKGAVEVELHFLLPKPKTVRRLLPHVKPDVDKLARACLDAMTGIAYEDDSQVTDLIVRKRYAVAQPTGVLIKVVSFGE